MCLVLQIHEEHDDNVLVDQFNSCLTQILVQMLHFYNRMREFSYSSADNLRIFHNVLLMHYKLALCTFNSTDQCIFSCETVNLAPVDHKYNNVLFQTACYIIVKYYTKNQLYICDIIGTPSHNNLIG